jgi:threonine/homoserine/homoserine lactone efflux protein
VVAFLIALLPSAGVLLIFWIGIRALLEADRRERAAQARFEAAARAHNHGTSPAVPISRGEAAAGGPEEGSSTALPPSS